MFVRQTFNVITTGADWYEKLKMLMDHNLFVGDQQPTSIVLLATDLADLEFAKLLLTPVPSLPSEATPVEVPSP